MHTNCTQIWSKCLEIIEKDVNIQSFQTWFKPIIPKTIHDNVLTIQVPSKFFYEWIEENYLEVLKKAMVTVLGKRCKLEYIILANRPQSAEAPAPTDTRSNPKIIDRKNIPPQKLPEPTFFIESQFNSNYKFDTFVEGSSNKTVKYAATSIANSLGVTSFNPFIIYGRVGIGKTHIAQAIGNHTISTKADKKVTYVPSELFAYQYVQAIKTDNISTFSKKFMNTDLLIVDDIQFFSGKEKTQETFFQIFNHLHQNGKQLVMTSDTPPNTMVGLQERLLSRFKWGLIAEIKNPDIDTRKSIIKKKASTQDIFINDDVIDYVASFQDTNIRELEGILNSVFIHARINNTDITVDLAKKVAGSIIKDIDKDPISLDKLLTIVSRNYKVDATSLKKDIRSKDVSFARKVAMHLAKNYTTHTLKDIGTFFGNRHHSTVLHSINSVNQILEKDQYVKKNYSNIITELGICT